MSVFVQGVILTINQMSNTLKKRLTEFDEQLASFRVYLISCLRRELGTRLSDVQLLTETWKLALSTSIVRSYKSTDRRLKLWYQKCVKIEKLELSRNHSEKTVETRILRIFVVLYLNYQR